MMSRLSIAPMLDVTDRHCRAFLRLFSRRMKIYTEMIVSGSIIHGDRDRFLEFSPCEHPLSIQLGGFDPAQLAMCARLAEDAGYDEVNLNIGCPSDRVINGRFGACLMTNPGLVSECVSEMCKTVSIPVTVKTRIGVDNHDSYEHLRDFIDQVSRGGCEHFIVHARKAWLEGLSPKENRNVPPLHYDRVYRLKDDFPEIRFSINGGINTLEEALEHLRYVDGVMIGRMAYQDPWMLTSVDRVIFNDPDCGAAAIETRADLVRAYFPYIEQQLVRGVYLRHMTRHMLGLFHGQPGARRWRRYLSEHGPKKGAGLEVIGEALKFVEFEAGECRSADVPVLAGRTVSNTAWPGLVDSSRG